MRVGGRGLMIMRRGSLQFCCLLLVLSTCAAFLGPPPTHTHDEASFPIAHTSVRRRLQDTNFRRHFSPGNLSNSLKVTRELSGRNPPFTLQAACSLHHALAVVRPFSGINSALRSTPSGLALASPWLSTSLRAVLAALQPSPFELELVSRLALAAAAGMAVGLERRTAHRPAGVRTM